jgi:hypothetical protein
MTEPDYSIHLIRAERDTKEIYAEAANRRMGHAVLVAITVIRHLLDFIEWQVRANTKTK